MKKGLSRKFYSSDDDHEVDEEKQEEEDPSESTIINFQKLARKNSITRKENMKRTTLKDIKTCIESHSKARISSQHQAH
jgi:hypothetical protein